VAHRATAETAGGGPNCSVTPERTVGGSASGGKSPSHLALITSASSRGWAEGSQMKIDGRCHCGAICYEADIDPNTVVICHCSDCQTFSGAPYRTSVAVPLLKLQLTGTPTVYCKTADSGRQVKTTFCGACGTALYSHGEGRDFVFLRLGSVRQRSQLPPMRQGFCHSAELWAMDIRNVPQVVTKPSGGVAPSA
jgi:hypothetical protein